MLPFLDQDRDPNMNKMLFAISQASIVRSAVNGKLIVDNDLAMIPEAMPILVRLAGTLRDDFYKYHTSRRTALSFEIMNNCFRYCFGKGAESAYAWNENSKGKFEFTYDVADALEGNVGASVSEDFALKITIGLERAYNVFCDFQNEVLASKELHFDEGGRWLADGIAMGFFIATQIGVDFGMKELGFP
jgi:hypothetical protein